MANMWLGMTESSLLPCPGMLLPDSKPETFSSHGATAEEEEESQENIRSKLGGAGKPGPPDRQESKDRLVARDSGSCISLMGISMTELTSNESPPSQGHSSSICFTILFLDFVSW